MRCLDLAFPSDHRIQDTLVRGRVLTDYVSE